ncbi:bifunctional metallophosphatase/5'-nucleotidase [Paenibacillus glacialis]|uniref:Bifunctional metallophosphatase/5'-nucleotidase n=1 Tax=Paenibacillus glacialis TaxID=494026 RepID=A0A168LSG8_9BACL|nr:bifunctional UDP-sugar hydrolase/5'-nucleotidase [Paenibacillus glacialis]OAB43778.1 bifunctional metallophosphatase/5'-nucleotidase [Paenibacillus glacialis]
MKDKKREMKIIILVTSDIHGYIVPCSYVDGSSVEHGLSSISTLIAEQRKVEGEVLLIDNGDFLQGSPLAYHQAKVNPSQPGVIIACMNCIGYDAVVPGNHEFNFGRNYLEQEMAASKFPWLSANVISETTGEPLFGKPYRIWEWDNGVRLAVLGLTTSYVPNWEQADHIQGMKFIDPITTAKHWIPYLREEERVDIVIVSYHGGFERDLSTGEASETLTGENQGYALCQEVPGIDVILTGHQHRAIAGESVNGVCVVQPGSEGSYLGKVTLHINRIEDHWLVVDKQSELLSSKNTKSDQDIVELVEPAEKALALWMDQSIGGVIGEDMRISNPLQTRLSDHPFMEWINSVQMELSGALISCAAIFDNHSPGFDRNITMRDIMINYKYPNTLTVLRVTGQDIKDALERSAQYFQRNEMGEIEVSEDFLLPKPQHFNYDMWEGIEYMIDVSRARGDRIVRLEYEGNPISTRQEYDVVMNNYRASGGGEYPMFKGKKIIKEIRVDMVEILADYIKSKGEITATLNNNWSVISGKK